MRKVKLQHPFETTRETSEFIENYVTVIISVTIKVKSSQIDQKQK